jgi:hypothetical protein
MKRALLQSSTGDLSNNCFAHTIASSSDAQAKLRCERALPTSSTETSITGHLLNFARHFMRSRRAEYTPDDSATLTPNCNVRRLKP